MGINSDIQLSVVLPMYNSEKYIREALSSLQKQTFTNFEVIIIDNCSEDKSCEIVKDICDERFHVYKNDDNKGLLYSLQRGVSLATGKYVARLDSDDISYPLRFEKQIMFLEEHPDVMLCSCISDSILNDERVTLTEYPIYGNEAIKFSLLYRDFCIAHSSFMFRREEMKQAGIEYEKFQHCQDYHLLLSIAQNNKIERLPEILVGYRVHAEQLSQTDDEDFVNGEDASIRKIYMKDIGFHSEKENIFWKALQNDLVGRKDIEDFEIFMNEHAKHINVDISTLGTNGYLCAQFVFWHFCTSQKMRNLQLLSSYLKSPLRNYKWLLGTKEGFLWACCCIVGYNTRSK